MIDVDPVITDAERGETVALHGQILMFGGHPRVAHKKLINRSDLTDD